MINIVDKRFRFFWVALGLVIFSIISLGGFGLRQGIEFSSGSLLTVNFQRMIAEDDLKQELGELGYGTAIVQQTNEGGFLIRTGELSDQAKAELESGLTARFGEVIESEFNSVSPMVASETARNAGIAIAVACVGILLYITWAFRKMPHPFRYGVCALLALGHDALVALGVFALLGHLFGWEINLMFITGILAVLGYSINNTVVVFDRIRENLKRGISTDLAAVVNTSLSDTMTRSMNTSLTTLFVLLALLLFVGASIQNFAIVLLVGVIAGTFSSICIAPNLLVVWERGDWGRLFRRREPAVLEAGQE